ncbi:MAG: ABC transporter permease [Chloroflexi bacterium]|nr:ABC transporter permease [Chloroflexota bacterium]
MSARDRSRQVSGGARQRRPETMARMVWRRFLYHKPAVVSLAALAVLLLAAILAPLLSPHGPNQIDLDRQLALPSWEHPLGTDHLGRDLLARLLYGGRVSLLIGLLAMAFATSFGTLVGALAGYYGGWVDSLLMRLTDVFLCFPGLFVLIILSLALRQLPIPALRGTALASILAIALVIALLAWMTVAKLVRASFLSLRHQDFVEAARAAGVTNARIIWRHILPNAISPVIIASTFRVATAIITESGLSYLGFGVQPPTPTWGNMLKNAQEHMLQTGTNGPWAAILPGLMIFVTVVAINFVGDGLRDALDPHKGQGANPPTQSN